MFLHPVLMSEKEKKDPFPRGGAGSANAGGGVPENRKTGLIHVSVAHFVGRLVCYRGFTGAKEVFSGKNRISICGLEE